MRRFLLFCLCSILVYAETSAQGFSKEYLDSVKQFFRSTPLTDWIQKAGYGQPVIHPVIMDHSVDSSNKNASADAFITDRRTSVIYHFSPKYIKVDSIVLTRQEKQEIIEKTSGQLSKQFMWVHEYFPMANFLKTNSFGHVFLESANTMLYPNGIFVISLPTFLRNNSICIFNYSCIFGGSGGRNRFEVYKKVNGTWWKYGEFGGGDWLYYFSLHFN